VCLLRCSFCSFDHADTDNFCPKCGKSPSAKKPYSDFDLGRTAAPETIKRYFWTWFLTGSAVFGILAIFGVNEVVKNKVGDAVSSQLRRIQNTITEASTKAVESSAKADLETKRVESTLAEVAPPESAREVIERDRTTETGVGQVDC
jgi:hypothetical protein